MRNPWPLLKQGAAALLFAYVVVANTVASVPRPPAVPVTFVQQLETLSYTWLYPTLGAPLERVGLHNRWNMFTHGADDPTHQWVNSNYTIRISDASGTVETYAMQDIPHQDLVERYLEYRRQRFKNVFWMMADRFGPPYVYHQVGRFLREHPGAVFPIDTRIDLMMQRLAGPGALAEPEATTKEFLRRTVSAGERLCLPD